MTRAFCVILLTATLAWADNINEQTPNATSVQATCNGTSSVVVAGGGKKAWTVMNQSAVDSFLCLAAVCTTATGLRLQQNMSVSEQTYIGPVSCITAGGTATLGIWVR